MSSVDTTAGAAETGVSRTLLRRFARYYRPHLRLFTLDMSCAFAVAALELVFPMMTRYMINVVIPSRNMNLLLWLIGALVLLYVVVAGLTYIINFWGHAVGIRMEADMRREIFSHLQRLSFRFYDNHRTGKLMSRVVNDLNDITELAHHGPEDLFLSTIMMSGSLAVLFVVEWRLALAMAAFIPLMGWFAIAQRGAMQSAFRQVRERIADLNAQLENSISGNRVVQAFSNEDYEINKFHDSNTLFKKAKYFAYRAMSRFMTGMGFFTNFLNVVVIGYGGVLIYLEIIDVGDLIAFVLYIGLIVQPVRRLTNFTQQFEQGMTGFRRFTEIMDETPDIRDRSHASELVNVQGRVEFVDVTFSYDEEAHVLRHVNLEIPAGKTVALVGPSGAGKTTMCNLIPRFYEVSAGAITIDGVDIRDVQLTSLRRAIGIVQQDVFLFTGTVRENILYGDVEATESQVIQAAKRANIHEFVSRQPDGYDTEIGEKGIRLSGGQKQRLAIARAFLMNPPILLLDEATASLDNETEAKIQEALVELSSGRTTVVIAHRLSTIRNADEIVVLTDDGIAERGDHAALMAAGGLYRDLYNAQFKEQE
jgi:ATP-binding cassette, subfamily B, bacterial